MTGTAEPASGRDALAVELRALQDNLRQQGGTQKAAVEEANRRRRQAVGRPPDVPSPRKDGGVDLSLQAVNDWFPKQQDSKKPSTPPDFKDLWDVVAVMLEWTGQLTSRTASQLCRDWKKLHTKARRRNGLGKEVRGYLAAARKAAEQHPHPGSTGRTDPPSLAQVYVRQRSRSQLAHTVEPAEVVFQTAEPMCVLIGDPGVGKSTLLRTRMREAVGEWLGDTQNVGKTGTAVPVWVSARVLVAEATSIPDALAGATRKLSRYGRHPELDRAHFQQQPCTGARWQLLVDDLDELPDAAERRSVLEKLANAVACDPPLYRCVVATRPLAGNELDVLDRVLDRPAPRYELQPFTSQDLHTYTERFFATHWPQDEAARRAQQFTDALRTASLAELAHTPLMAFMLCQLYLADPERALRGGRTAVYEAFTGLLYENNQGKRIADSHEEAIQRLVERLQSPRAREEAEAAARQAHEQLPELVGYLAYQWLTGHHTPVAQALASHDAVRRPGKVHQQSWDEFLEGLLRHTGLLVQHADCLSFPHQTFLEYHAAQHATRDERARATLLDELFPPGQTPRVPATEPSYLGFLLDALLDSSEGIATQTASRIENLASLGGNRVCHFLMQQVTLTTNLPLAPTARQLTRFAQDRFLDPYTRVGAAQAMAGLDGYRDRAAQLLAQFADDTTPHYDRSSNRMWAARALAGVGGYRDAGAERLIAFAHDPAFWGFDRVQVVRALAGVDGYQDRAAQLLAQFADDPTLRGDRVRAARILAGMDGYRDRAAQHLAQLAADTTLYRDDRTWAARTLATIRSDGASESDNRDVR